MERGSDKHSARVDEALEAEVHGLVTGGHDTHAQEWASAEPSGEDQPAVDRSAGSGLHPGTPDGMSPADVEARSVLATYLGKEVWPASGAQLLAVAQGRSAPDDVLARLRRLTADRSYATLQEAWAELGGVEGSRF